MPALPDMMFYSATYHDAETVRNITDKHHFTWTHLVEVKDMVRVIEICVETPFLT